MAKQKKRPYRDVGSPEFTADDVPGTQFLMAAAGRHSSLSAARREHWRLKIDHGRHLARVGLSDFECSKDRIQGGGSVWTDPECPKSGTSCLLVETSDFLLKLAEKLTPRQVHLLYLLVRDSQGTPMHQLVREAAAELGVVTDTIYTWLRKIRALAQELRGAA